MICKSHWEATTMIPTGSPGAFSLPPRTIMMEMSIRSSAMILHTLDHSLMLHVTGASWINFSACPAYLELFTNAKDDEIMEFGTWMKSILSVWRFFFTDHNEKQTFTLNIPKNVIKKSLHFSPEREMWTGSPHWDFMYLHQVRKFRIPGITHESHNNASLRFSSFY